MVEYKIDFKGYEVDASGRVRPSSVLRRMQEIAGEDAAQYGLDYESMRQMGVVFVLSKIRLLFEEPVFASQDLDLISFARVTRGVSFFRDFHVFCGERKIVRGASRWALINFQTRRIERPSVLKNQIETFEEKFDGFDVERILLPENATLLHRDYRPVYPSMLDQNNHLNNCVYADLASDYLPDPNRAIKEIQIDFHHEARLGDILSISSFEIEGGVFVRGRFQADDSPCFDAEILTF